MECRVHAAHEALGRQQGSKNEGKVRRQGELMLAQQDEDVPDDLRQVDLAERDVTQQADDPVDLRFESTAVHSGIPGPGQQDVDDRGRVIDRDG